MELTTLANLFIALVTGCFHLAFFKLPWDYELRDSLIHLLSTMKRLSNYNPTNCNYNVL